MGNIEKNNQLLGDYQIVFGSFGDTSDSLIEKVFTTTFEAAPEREEECWFYKLPSSGAVISVCRNSGLGDVFSPEGYLDLLTTANSYFSEIGEDNYADLVTQPIDSWLALQLSSVKIEEYSDSWKELNVVKDNFMELGGGIAFEFDNFEVTFPHPCGGFTGEDLLLRMTEL